MLIVTFDKPRRPPLNYQINPNIPVSLREALMKRVGILVGREKTFPEAMIKNINERGKGAVVAEYLKLGGIRHDAPPQYDLVIDRISHEVPFYRATLKRLALEGTFIINNPFWWSADSKIFNFALAAKLGVAIPKT